jgi:hypothetical protein
MAGKTPSDTLSYRNKHPKDPSGSPDARQKRQAKSPSLSGIPIKHSSGGDFNFFEQYIMQFTRTDTTVSSSISFVAVQSIHPCIGSHNSAASSNTTPLCYVGQLSALVSGHCVTFEPIHYCVSFLSPSSFQVLMTSADATLLWHSNNTIAVSLILRNPRLPVLGAMSAKPWA